MHPLPLNAAASRQKGVVLVVALVLLVAITLLSLAGISTTTLELLMATNQQARTNAFQQAEAGIDAVIYAVDGNLANFPVFGPVGEQRCTPGFHDDRYYDASGEVTCSSPDLIVPAAYDFTHSRAVVGRLPPCQQAAPRFMENTFRIQVATFKIDSRFDARDTRQGRAEHNQGIIVTLPPTTPVFGCDDIDI